MSESQVQPALSAEILKTIKPGNRIRLNNVRTIDRDAWYLVTSVLSNKSKDARALGVIPMPNSQYHQPLGDLGDQKVELVGVDQITDIESIWSVDVEKNRICFLPLEQTFEVSNGNIYEVDEDGGKVSNPYGREGLDPVKRAYNLYLAIMANQVTGKVS